MAIAQAAARGGKTIKGVGSRVFATYDDAERYLAESIYGKKFSVWKVIGVDWQTDIETDNDGTHRLVRGSFNLERRELVKAVAAQTGVDITVVPATGEDVGPQTDRADELRARGVSSRVKSGRSSVARVMVFIVSCAVTVRVLPI